MPYYNRVVLVGNVTRDIELRRTQQGTAVTDLGLAVNERVKRNDEWVDETNFFDVTLWGRTAEVASEYLSKGAPVLIEGRLKYEQWDTENGKRSKVKVVGEKMQLLGGKPSAEQKPEPTKSYTSNRKQATASQVMDDPKDIPF